MSDREFPPVPSGYPFPRLEQEVLDEWTVRDVFRRTLEKDAPRGDWVFYEGPPTANNVPHVGHVVTRVVKDLFPRFQTMNGHRVLRKAGWDTHGLPVEIEVEKRLGFSGKEQIEEYGIAAFNAACLESVHTYERQWRVMTERVGYWTDLDDAYFTYTNEYVESVWWALSELWKKGLLVEGHKIQPYCARCGTTLSSHEVAQNYKEADDPSVWVLFPARPGQSVETVSGQRWAVGPELRLIAWTTTPWTLLAHVALAIHPEMTYRIVEHPGAPGSRLLFGDDLQVPVPMLSTDEEGQRRSIDLRDRPVLARVPGRELVGLRYERPFTFFPAPGGDEQEGPWRVVAGDYVTASEGTGLVHTAPPFGEDDYATGQRHDLPFHLAVDGEGRIVEAATPFAGLWFKDADPPITRDLKERGRLLHQARYLHNYPFCWRCDTPLLYYATESWFVATTRRKAQLVESNRTIDWHPAHVGEGRFGNWLENMVDWALSRSRYWGTPLPVWRCEGSDCAAITVPASYRELFAAAGRDLPDDPYDREQFDPHRPFIDEMTFACSSCGGVMRRVPEVIDAWFDSGSMPFAQHHYPFENRELFARQFPADLISEAVDQTRGWFYTLHVLANLLFDSVAYRHCVVLGHVNDEEGRKMSKRLGNVVEPMAVLEETGADALRWYFCRSNPEQPSRFSARLVREAAQRFLLPLWNALSFFTIYANLDGWRPGRAPVVPLDERPALDRWMLLRLDQVVRRVTDALEGFAVAEATREIEELVEELTNWYIRRSRGRFWSAAAGDGVGKESAYQSLYEVLVTLARLLAPFTPFLADVLWRHLVRSQDSQALDSVHLAAWPQPGEREDEELLAAMAAAQRIVGLGHAARNSHGLKTRQPLAGVTLVTADDDLPSRVAPHEELLREELNVQEIRWAEDRSEYVRHEVRPVFPRLGPRFGKRMQEVKRALAEADGDALAAELEARGSLSISLGDETITLAGDDVEVRLEERAGMATAGDRELLVALDTDLTPDLVREGLAREVIHKIQTARKDADLGYADRIRVAYRSGATLEAAIAAHRDHIAGETLAMELAPADGDEHLEETSVESEPFSFRIERV
jgi:isoleucyl-tRNA synthetase